MDLKKIVEVGKYRMCRRVGLWYAYNLRDSLLFEKYYDDYITTGDTTELDIYAEEKIKGKIINGKLEGT